MALQGTLRDFSLADILQLIGLQRKTGVLRLSGSEDTVSVLFEEGRIVGSESEFRHVEDRLGHVLLKSGKVSRADLNRVLSKQKQTGSRIGDLLVQTRALSEEDLRCALELQVTQIIYRLFRWSEGEFRFTQTSTVDYDSERFRPVPVESILMEGLRILDEWPLIERRVHSLDLVYAVSDANRTIRSVAEDQQTRDDANDTDLDEVFDALAEGSAAAAPQAPAEPEDEREVVTVSAREWAVYRLVDGHRQVQEIVDCSDLGEFETCKALFELLEKDLIEERVTQSRAPLAVKKPVFSMDAIMSVGAIFLAAALLTAGAWQHLPLQPERLFSPYSGVSETVDTLRLSASQSRMARIESAISVYTLLRPGYPETLGDLAHMGLLHPGDLADPWGRDYEYILTRRSYQIRGTDRDGLERPELVVTGRLEERQNWSLTRSSAVSR